MKKGLDFFPLDVDFFDDEKVQFVYKLWNASRFVLMNAKDVKIPSLAEIRLQPADRWIISHLQATIREVTASLGKFDLGIAADKLVDFVWNDFCDWYIELSKPALYGEDAEKKRAALGVLMSVLEDVLKLLHPFIPYVTEEIYSYLPTTKGLIITADYPRYNSRLAYKKEAKAFEGIIDLIKSVRAMKVDVNCPPSRKVHVYLVTESRRLVSINKGAILRLAGASDVSFVENGPEAGAKVVSSVCEIGQIFVPLGELVDLEKEKARLEKELDRVISEISRASGKLANQSFIAKAPKKLVDDERAKLEKLLDAKTKVEERLKDFD